MTLVKYACDCCRIRRVKCDGKRPCNRCLQHDLKCTYLQPLGKRGPKNIRSRSLKKIAETQTFSENNNCMTALEISIGIIISYMLLCSVVVTNFRDLFGCYYPCL
ncbi:BDN_1c_G0004750.mRNA.1.CDS.1 [Saccharomyces cerevisiae]|nr:BDN_1c_G0004750.mRNA.1.CDS.1 [Saccharomyces cerevisiae]CAI7052388.1 BDN_1c_G0004750.mRNA.1.CDS.1 [Saccharomyces cerevisiae]